MRPLLHIRAMVLRSSDAMASGTIRTVIPIASAMRSMDDKRGSRLPLSISDKCCGRIDDYGPTLADRLSSVRQR